jgi:hypothetical protein
MSDSSRVVKNFGTPLTGGVSASGLFHRQHHHFAELRCLGDAAYARL